MKEQGAAPDLTREAGIVRGQVVEALTELRYRVCVEHQGVVRDCALLMTPGHKPTSLTVGARVLVWTAEDEGIILGILDPEEGIPRVGGGPDEILIEAGKSLTLKVGDGSITIREDGKILIKGTHLVSHAKKMNRIRGGSVAIN